MIFYSLLKTLWLVRLLYWVISQLLAPPLWVRHLVLSEIPILLLVSLLVLGVIPRVFWLQGMMLGGLPEPMSIGIEEFLLWVMECWCPSLRISPSLLFLFSFEGCSLFALSLPIFWVLFGVNSLVNILFGRASFECGFMYYIGWFWACFASSDACIFFMLYILAGAFGSILSLKKKRFM